MDSLRRRSSRLAGALIAVATLAAGHASATSMALDGGSLAAARHPVEPCDASVSVSWTTEYDPGLDDLTVDVVSLGDIDAACDGQVFQVTLADGSNAALGAGTYADPAGASGQVTPGGGAGQVVTFDLTGQAVLDAAVDRSAWSIAP